MPRHFLCGMVTLNVKKKSRLDPPLFYGSFCFVLRVSPSSSLGIALSGLQSASFLIKVLSSISRPLSTLLGQFFASFKENSKRLKNFFVNHPTSSTAIYFMTFFNESRENSFFKLSVLSEHGFFLLVSLLVRAYCMGIVLPCQPAIS